MDLSGIEEGSSWQVEKSAFGLGFDTLTRQKETVQELAKRLDKEADQMAVLNRQKIEGNRNLRKGAMISDEMMMASYISPDILCCSRLHMNFISHHVVLDRSDPYIFLYRINLYYKFNVMRHDLLFPDARPREGLGHQRLRGGGRERARARGGQGGGGGLERRGPLRARRHQRLRQSEEQRTALKCGRHEIYMI